MGPRGNFRSDTATSVTQYLTERVKAATAKGRGMKGVDGGGSRGSQDFS